MKSVLVAGGAGFVGSHLVDRLLRRADIARLVVVDSLWTGLVDSLSRSDTGATAVAVGSATSPTSRESR